jgi:hypothetical protein
MFNPASGEQFPNPHPNNEELLATALDQVRTALEPALAETVLPTGTVLHRVSTELYQSPELRAVREAMPNAHNLDDRSLITLTLQKGQQVFLVGGKASPTNLLDMAYALSNGVDQRQTSRTVYAYDGAQTITEYMEDGTVTNYTGEYGDPEILLSHIRDTLGTLVGGESVGLYSK